MPLDTNVIVRHLTGEPREQAPRATAFLRDAESLELLRAVELYETAGVHFAEAYLTAMAEQGDGLVGSFDRDLDRIDGVTRVEP